MGAVLRVGISGRLADCTLGQMNEKENSQMRPRLSRIENTGNEQTGTGF